MSRATAGLGAVALVVALVVAAGAVWVVVTGDSAAEDSGPVITPAEDWNGYPTAEVTGTLSLADGCLMVDDAVVFWPKGTGWDDDTQEVVFDGSRRQAVGEQFSGGGGGYPAGTDFADLLGSADAAERIADCLDEHPGASVVFAYP